MLPEFEFTLPVSGKVINWRPLSIGVSLDLASSFKNNEIMLTPALLMQRIFRYDGKDGRPEDWREWDEFDYGSFADEVNTQEAARAATFKKKRAGGDLEGVFMQCLIDAQSATQNLGRALTAMLEAQRAAKIAKDPLA